MNARTEQLLEILALSRALHAGAAAGEWDRLVALERRRRDLLEGYFAEPHAADESDMVQAVLREILDLDRELLAFCEQARRETGEQLRLVAKGRSAVRAYGGLTR